MVQSARGNGSAKEVARGAIHSIGMRADLGGNLLVTGASLHTGAKAVPGVASLPGAERRAFVSSTRKIIVNDVAPSSAVAADSAEAGSSVLDANEHASGASRLHGVVAGAGRTSNSSWVTSPRARLSGRTRRRPDRTRKGRSGRCATSRLRSRWLSVPQAPPLSLTFRRLADRRMTRWKPSATALSHETTPAIRPTSPSLARSNRRVDRAVKGQLTEYRPANSRNLGMASYSPQGMFPR